MAGRFSGYAAVCLWSTSASVLSLIDRHDSVSTIITVEYAFASLFMAAIAIAKALASRRGATNSAKSGWTRPKWAEVALVVAFSSLNVFHELTYFLGIRSECPFEANVVNYLWPLWLFLLSAPRNRAGSQSSTLRKAVPLLVAFSGMAFMLLSPLGSAPCGNVPFAYGLASSFGAAGYMLIFARLSKEYNVEFSTLLTITLPISTLALGLINPIETMQMHWLIYSLPFVVYLALFTIVVPELLWSFALVRIGGSGIALSAFFIPLFSTIWLAVVKQEMPSARVFVGGAVILSSLWLSMKADDRRSI